MTRLCIHCRGVYGCVVGIEKHLCVNCVESINCPKQAVMPDDLLTHGVCPLCFPQHYRKEDFEFPAISFF